MFLVLQCKLMNKLQYSQLQLQVRNKCTSHHCANMSFLYSNLLNKWKSSKVRRFCSSARSSTWDPGEWPGTPVSKIIQTSPELIWRSTYFLYKHHHVGVVAITTSPTTLRCQHGGLSWKTSSRLVTNDGLTMCFLIHLEGILSDIYHIFSSILHQN